MPTVDLLVTSPPGFAAQDVAPDGFELRLGRLDRAVPGDGPVWIALDWELEGETGLDRCKALRADPRYVRAHIVMLLPENSLDDARAALAAGANDAMLAPLDPDKLREQMEKLLPQQAQSAHGGRLQYGPLLVDCDAIQARWNGTLLQLPLNEFRLLYFLGCNANRVLSRNELIAGLGKDDQPIDERTVDVWVARLRRALAQAGAEGVVRTVRPLGYVLDLD
ncbi:winged helix-turn-helix transcriptional regulator [Pseudoblastomonas halimionae]|uniref:DNA-binding response regulator n=1 Tax=Alteriqipengyuania halimionae TaxID=1926630 RepID=A0A6I4TYC2_9SPHN|nr:winged helix-turn-helix domain-containing protein [Alteriqipengyuania halimionae]MXP08650.1 DNA-binding response regulator [Alteriqipengyuania halimionae]